MMLYVDIVHRNNEWLIDADYFSRCRANLWFDPLLVEYDAYAATLRKLHAPPIGPLQPENMPGYHLSYAWLQETFLLGVLKDTDKTCLGDIGDMSSRHV